MGDYKNLEAAEGIKKLQELVKSQGMCMFASNMSEYPVSARPMSTLEADDAGNLWFFSKESSEKNEEIIADGRVQLFYANTGSSEYLTVTGNAVIEKDKAKAEELWTRWAKTWFNEGVDDPELTIIKVEAVDAHYWDTKNNKLVSLLKMATGAITGNTMDDGVEGDITV